MTSGTRAGSCDPKNKFPMWILGSPCCNERESALMFRVTVHTGIPLLNHLQMLATDPGFCAALESLLGVTPQTFIGGRPTKRLMTPLTVRDISMMAA